MKKIAVWLVGIVLIGVGAQGQTVLGTQEALHTLMNDPLSWQNAENQVNGVPDDIVRNDGIFDPPAEMYEIIGRINKANATGMTKKQMIGFVEELTNFISAHPQESIHGYMQLGNLYRTVKPQYLRNRERAIEMYDRVQSLLPGSDKSNRGQLYYIMAHCYEYGEASGDMSRIAIYTQRALKNSPRFACSMGDLYMCGLGCYQDLYVSALLYDLAQRHGDETAYNNLHALEYIITHNAAQEDRIKDHFRSFLFNLRLANNIGEAESELQAAAQLGFVPAYYILGSMYERIIENLPEDLRRKEMFQWYRRGADANFIPCINALARCTQQYTMDSLKGDIYKGEEANKPKVKALCAKQSLELYTRAANLGSPVAMHVLGDLYAKGGEANYPNQDLAAAYYWYTLALKMGNASVTTSKQVLEQLYNPTAEDKKAVDRFVLGTTDVSENYVIKLLKKIEQHPSYKHHNHLATLSLIHVSEMDRVTEVASYNDHLAQTYKMVYELYAEKVADMAQENNVEPTHLKAIQDFMKNLRKHSAGNPIDYTKQSMWETWTPD